MANQPFLTKGQSLLRIELDSGIDLDTIDTFSIIYGKPDENGTLGEFTGCTAKINTAVTPNLKSIVCYEVQEGDLDVEGTWEFRTYITAGGRDVEGEPFLYHFSRSLRPT